MNNNINIEKYWINKNQHERFYFNPQFSKGRNILIKRFFFSLFYYNLNLMIYYHLLYYFLLKNLKFILYLKNILILLNYLLFFFKISYDNFFKCFKIVKIILIN